MLATLWFASATLCLALVSPVFSIDFDERPNACTSFDFSGGSADLELIEEQEDSMLFVGAHKYNAANGAFQTSGG